MQDTCKQKDCHLWKKYGERCPNYIKTEWKNEQEAQLKLVHDCAPIRTMLMLADFTNRLIGVEKSNEQVRNVVIGIKEVIDMRKAQALQIKRIEEIEG